MMCQQIGEQMSSMIECELIRSIRDRQAAVRALALADSAALRERVVATFGFEFYVTSSDVSNLFCFNLSFAPIWRFSRSGEDTEIVNAAGI
jgi:hypothetical protein